VRSCGDDLISIAVANPREGQVLAGRLREAGSWIEVVAGMDSIVVQIDIAQLDLEHAVGAIQDVLNVPFDEPESSQSAVEIPISYGGEDGPDLSTVCQQLGLSEQEFVELHTSQEQTVNMLGFTPGFAYIGELDQRLNVPRLAMPRVSVRAGSVGIADGQTGLYALQGPGGWSIVGHTKFKLFDTSIEHCFVLRPGRKVRFVVQNQS